MSKSSPRIRGTTPEIEQAAIELRRELTPTEKLLWQALRSRKIAGFNFAVSIRWDALFLTFTALSAS